MADLITQGMHGCSQEDEYVRPTDPNIVQRLEWFQDQKLAMMMHFGIYSELGICESWPLSDGDADWSRRGIQAVGRIKDMVGDLELNPQIMKLIVNRAPGGVADSGVLEEIEKQGLDLLGVLPQDDAVYRYDCDGRPSASVPDDNPVKRALDPLFRECIQ